MNQEHAALRATVEEFARKEVAPVIADLYEHDTFPYALVAKMGAMGLFGSPFPGSCDRSGAEVHPVDGGQVGRLFIFEFRRLLFVGTRLARDRRQGSLAKGPRTS